MKALLFPDFKNMENEERPLEKHDAEIDASNLYSDPKCFRSNSKGSKQYPQTVVYYIRSCPHTLCIVWCRFPFSPLPRFLAR